MSPTLRSFLDGMQAGDLSQAIRDNGSLYQDLAGAAPTDLWSFCIGADFVNMPIDTKLHAMFKSGVFSPPRFFNCTTGSPAHMKAQLDTLLHNPGKCMTFSFIHSLNNSQQSASGAASSTLDLSRAAWPLSWASSSVEALAGIPFLVQWCAPLLFPKSRSVRDRSISAPSLECQACSPAAALLAALSFAAVTGILHYNMQLLTMQILW
jgi:hypothetical protein